MKIAGTQRNASEHTRTTHGKQPLKAPGNASARLGNTKSLSVTNIKDFESMGERSSPSSSNRTDVLYSHRSNSPRSPSLPNVSNKMSPPSPSKIDPLPPAPADSAMESSKSRWQFNVADILEAKEQTTGAKSFQTGRES
mmetsp:Transcript_2293/g.6950  ORF Transcript_2293/g.6950 Transcript_2293/m.6950 type:complete len:139 (+) Transcript_2293:713-1129(+)